MAGRGSEPWPPKAATPLGAAVTRWNKLGPFVKSRVKNCVILHMYFSSSSWSISALNAHTPCADGHLRGTCHSVSHTGLVTTQLVRSAHLICVIVAVWLPASFQLGFRASDSVELLKPERMFWRSLSWHAGISNRFLCSGVHT